MFIIYLAALTFLARPIESTNKESLTYGEKYGFLAEYARDLVKTAFGCKTGPDEAPHLGTKGFFGAVHVVMRRHNDIHADDCYIENMFRDGNNVTDRVDPIGMSVVISRKDERCFPNLKVTHDSQVYKNIVSSNKHEYKGCAPRCLCMALYELGKFPVKKQSRKQVAPHFRKVFATIREKQGTNAISKFLKEIGRPIESLGSLPDGVKDAVEKLYRHDLTAEVFITKRALKNFPRVMSAFSRVFKATIVPEMPVLESHQRALEWTFPYSREDKVFHKYESSYSSSVARCYQLFGFYPELAAQLTLYEYYEDLRLRRANREIPLEQQKMSRDEEAFFLAFGRWPQEGEIQAKTRKPFERKSQQVSVWLWWAAILCASVWIGAAC